MRRPSVKKILTFSLIPLTLIIMSVAYAFWGIGKSVDFQSAQKHFLQLTEIYIPAFQFKIKDAFVREDIENKFAKIGYRARLPQQPLLSGDYLFTNLNECQQRGWGQGLATDQIKDCLLIKKKDSEQMIAIFSQSDSPNPEQSGAQIISLETPSPGNLTSKLTFEKFPFAQYLGAEPLQQEFTPLSQIPSQCLKAAVAIEDRDFLDHKGVSAMGIARAIWKNIRSGKKAQGGSTITQQLVKNAFLTSERTYKRKIQEILLALELETSWGKDQIIETYLNVIYMGQSGSFRIHGFGSASRYLLGHALNSASLAECALLAAVINNPGGLVPWKYPEAASKRRALVLQKMRELEWISADEFAEASVAPLPLRSQGREARETAPYFIQAVTEKMKELDLPWEGSKIWISLSTSQQQIAQEAFQKTLDELELRKKQNLEGAFILLNNTNGEVQVLIGGRNFRRTQFNRVVSAKRLVGSVMKPLVYLSGFINGNIKPDDQVIDEPFTYKYENQTWTPENYDRKYHGTLPVVKALEQSLNIPAAKLATQIGIPKIIELAHALGVKSEMPAIPALSLGATDWSPWEVAQAYSTLANLGEKRSISVFQKVETVDGKIWENNAPAERVVDAKKTAQIVQLMKYVVDRGSGQIVRKKGFTGIAAGKTGTTSDLKDTWFAAFSPEWTAVAWVGRDDGKSTGYTGASAAAPLWAEIMTKLKNISSDQDFIWPEGLKQKTISDPGSDFEYKIFTD